VEQKNWAVVRTVVGYHRYDTSAELVLLNKIWTLQSPDELLPSPAEARLQGPRRREGAKKYDTATTPHRRAERHEAVSEQDKAILTDTYVDLNPAAIQRQIQALTDQLLTLTTSKKGPATTGPRQSHVMPRICSDRAGSRAVQRRAEAMWYRRAGAGR